MRALWFLQSACLACTSVLAGCRTETEGLPVSPLVMPNGEARVIAIDAVEPRFQPALEALQAAVYSGDDRGARAVLASFFRLEPSGRALELAEAFERILDGRAAVADLDLRLETTFERDPGGRGVAVVSFVARSRAGRTLDVKPGPGLLHVKLASIDGQGDETKSLDTVPVEKPIRFSVSNGGEARLVLARMPFALPNGALAARAIFDLDLRSGNLRVDERDLPAMHLHTATGELVLLTKDLAGVELAGAGALADHVATGKCDGRVALAIAVRIPRDERGAALDLLARSCESMAETTIAALAPALRWLAPDMSLGEDAPAWRAWLRARARASEAKPDLILPRTPAPRLDGT